MATALSAQHANQLSSLYYGGSSASLLSDTVYTTFPKPIPTEKSNPKLMKTVINDIKEFIIEHKTIIYGVIVILLIDRFFLNGKLTERIKGMASKALGTIENKLDTAIAPKTTELK